MTSCMNLWINRINHYFYLCMICLSVSPLVYLFTLMFTCIHVYLYTCLPVYLSTFILVYISTLLTCLHFYLFTCLSVHIFTCKPAHLLTCLPDICWSVSLSNYLPDYLSISSSVYQSVCLLDYHFTSLPVWLPPIYFFTCLPYYLFTGLIV